MRPDDIYNQFACIQFADVQLKTDDLTEFCVYKHAYFVLNRKAIEIPRDALRTFVGFKSMSKCPGDTERVSSVS